VKAASLILALAVMTLSAPLATQAQPAAKVPRIGLLMPVSPASAASNVEAFRQGLRERGYIEGESVIIDYRYADGTAQPCPVSRPSWCASRLTSW
jgi:putative ABC transport system substrate-binding protein